MKASGQDVEAMAGALIATTQSMTRVSRKGDAGRLMALYAIAAHAESSPKALSEVLGVHASSVTRQIQALEKDGQVKVTADPKDKRSRRVKLTAAGRAEITRLQEQGLQRFASFVAKWDAAEVRELTRLLMKLEKSEAEVGASARPARAGWREKK
ncbi:MAG: MarR family winged helix-turn-helix transcriptional regulator [Acidobacteriaceae bacterium]